MDSRTMMLAAVLGLAAGTNAHAAEVRVLVSGAIRAAMTDIKPLFEQATEHKLIVSSDTSGRIARRIADGEQTDLVIVTSGGIDDLIKQGKVMAGSKAESRALRPRRRRANGRAQARHLDAGKIQGRAARRQDGGLHQSGQRRRERRLFRQDARPARHRRARSTGRPNSAKAARSRRSSRAATPNSASSRSPSCSPIRAWITSARCPASCSSTPGSRPAFWPTASRPKRPGRCSRSSPPRPRWRR